MEILDAAELPPGFVLEGPAAQNPPPSPKPSQAAAGGRPSLVQPAIGNPEVPPEDPTLPKGFKVIEVPPGSFSTFADKTQEVRSTDFEFSPSGGDGVSGANIPEIGFFDQLRAGLAISDPKKRIKRFSEILGIPENQFGVVDGEVVFFNGKKLQKVVPDVEGSLTEKFFALGENVAANTAGALPSVAGAAAGVLTGPTGASIPAAGAAAGITEFGLQVLDRLIAGEPLEDFNLERVAGQVALNVAGQAGGVGLVRAFNRNPLKVSALDRTQALDPQILAEAEAIEKAAEARGISLSAGQKTGLRSLLQRERQVGRFDETADIVDDFRRTQREVQIPTAIRGEIDKVSTVQGEAGAAQFRSGAQEVTDQALRARSAEAKVAYEEAFSEPGFINERLKELLKRPSMKEAFFNAQRIAADEGRGLPRILITRKGKAVGTEVIPDFRAWDFIKRGLDDVIESNTNNLGRVNQKGRAALKLKKAMLKELDAANGSYAQARLKFGTASDAVDAVLEGGVGIVRKLPGLDRAAMLKRIFNANNIPAGEMLRVRNLFLKAGQEEEFNAGLATFLADRLDDTITRGGNTANTFFKLIWQDPRQRQLIITAMGGKGSQRVEAFEGLMKVLDAARRGLAEGSPTVTDLASISQGAVGKVGRGIGRLTSAEGILNPGQMVVDAIDALRTPAARVKLAEALLSPGNLKELQKLRLLGKVSGRSVQTAADFLVKMGIVTPVQSSGLTGLRDVPVPALSPQPRPLTSPAEPEAPAR